MKMQVISHAGLSVESHGHNLVIDPWTVGSCYWRSWWNYPEPSPELIDNLKPDSVYITHLHWDHFHGPSLHKFDNNTRFYVPKFNNERMVRDLVSLGFENVIEIPHGTTVEVKDGFKITSYQFGHINDSALVIETEGVTILDANDCKIFGMPLRHLLRRHGDIDFVLRSHSNASGYPYCVKGYEERFGDVRPQSEYIEEFASFAHAVGARYAIPFASNHCFLHKDTKRYNSHAVNPNNVKSFMEMKRTSDKDPKCVVMTPGSVWDSADGFNLVDFDYDNPGPYFEAKEKEHAAKLEASYAKEDKVSLRVAAFSKYFENLMEVMPTYFRNKLDVIVMRGTSERETKYVELNFKKKTIEYFDEYDTSGKIVIESPNKVFNDCSMRKMFSVWTASKRLLIQVENEDDLERVLLLFRVLDLYELEYFPLFSQAISIRSITTRLPRWREILEFVLVVGKVKLAKKKFSLSQEYWAMAYRAS